MQMIFIRLSSETGCDEITGSSHLLNKVNLDPVFPESNALNGTAFTIFNNDIEEISNGSMTQEDMEQPGHIILVPATKASQKAARKCWPR